MDAIQIPYFEVAAFANDAFSGNPAGVCVLTGKWLPDGLMQQIATENNLAETAFIIEREKYYDLRWMTPTVEIDLCGHATLASAHVIFQYLGCTSDAVSFRSKSEELRVDRRQDQLILDFPSQPASECDAPEKLTEGLRARAHAVLRGRGLDYFAVFEREEEIATIKPDFEVLMQLDTQGVVVTAPGNDCDFVSRYFAPAAGIPEDPVTGSTHCALIPYWSERLQKNKLHARQLSKRGGELFCENRGERVGIGGKAITYLVGELHVPRSDTITQKADEAVTQAL